MSALSQVPPVEQPKDTYVFNSMHNPDSTLQDSHIAVSLSDRGSPKGTYLFHDHNNKFGTDTRELCPNTADTVNVASGETTSTRQLPKPNSVFPAKCRDRMIDLCQETTHINSADFDDSEKSVGNLNCYDEKTSVISIEIESLLRYNNDNVESDSTLPSSTSSLSQSQLKHSPNTVLNGANRLPTTCRSDDG